MTQKDKDLLLKDLCTRLPYGVIVETPKGKGHICDINLTIFCNEVGVNINPTNRDKFNTEDCKPYLFPLLSMSEELKNFIKWKLTTPWHDSFDEDSIEDLLTNNVQVVHFCYEHHLDINGLIPKGIAEDATGKNIY